MYAHSVIEDPRDGTRYQRGDVVPDDIPGLNDLVDCGFVKETEYGEAERAAERVPPETIEVEGVVYRRVVAASDSGDSGEASA